MRAFGTFFLVVGLALILGVGSALYLVERGSFAADIKVGPWQSSSLAGSSDAGMYERAYVARSAMLALTRREATYYVAATDDDGNALTTSCRYSVSGEDFPARWWSITIYGEDQFLIPGENNEHSFTKTDMQAGHLPVFVFGLARADIAARMENPVLVSGMDPAKGFSMLLRLYHPADAVLNAPSQLGGPKITNLGCG